MGQGQALLCAAWGDSFSHMKKADTVTFYMEPALCESAVSGKHNFLGKVADVLAQAGLSVGFTQLPPHGAPAGKGWSLSHIKSPPDARGLCFRRAYHYPFWQIEQSAERWAWDVAQSDFIPDPADTKEAKRFYGFWQNRLFGDAPKAASRDGFVYVPLQGKLLDHRPFQICSPIDMVRHCLGHTDRRIIAALHPNERYSDTEIEALERLQATNTRLAVQTGGMQELLKTCEYIVTQNSSVAFNGYFFAKPSLLFRKADFHHIAVQADPNDLAAGFHAVSRIKPDYCAYVHWYLQRNSINAGRPEAAAQIVARLRRFDWPL